MFCRSNKSKGEEPVWHWPHRGKMLTRLFSEMNEHYHHSHKYSYRLVKDPEVPNCREVSYCLEVHHYSEVHYMKHLMIG